MDDVREVNSVFEDNASSQTNAHLNDYEDDSIVQEYIVTIHSVT